jgi:outer membrane protein assembly factor BamB
LKVSNRSWLIPLALLLGHSLAISIIHAQAGQWTTFGHDAQRSGNASDEHAFSPANVASLSLAWKTVVPNEPLFMNGLTAPLVVRGVKTSAGAQNLVLVAGSSDHIFALDAETGELVWKQDFKANHPHPSDGGWLCPYALNATPLIDAAKSSVFVIASDGRLHTLDLADGRDVIPPTQFVPDFSKMWSLNESNGVLYASLSQDCNHASSGVAALDLNVSGRPVTRFYSAVNGGAGVWGRGGVSIGFDGFIYGSTGDAPFDAAANEYGDTVFRLAPRTLALDGYFTPDNWQYITRRDLDMGTTTPIVFKWKDRALTAVGGKEGVIYVTDTAAMSGKDHHATAYISPRYTNVTQTFERNGIWGEMTAWKDAAGETWLYVPSWGEPSPAAQFPKQNGAAKDGSIMAFNVVAAVDGKPALKPAWISGDIVVPDPAAIAGGVLFVLGTGENTAQVNSGDISQILVGRESRNKGHAILHALDAKTGRELWSSGDTISSWTHFSGIAIADGKIFATTHDGAVYAFALRGANAPPARTTIVPGSPTSGAMAAAPQTPAGPAIVPQCGEASTTFNQRCTSCHNQDGRGNPATRAPNFTDPTWQASKTDQELIDALTNGTDKGMPAFSGQVSSSEIDRLIHCLVRGFAPATPQGR